MPSRKFPKIVHLSDVGALGNDYITSVTDPTGTQSEPTVAMSDPWLIVFPVQKRPGGAFRDQIGVGRTRNNDIALPYPRISKYHAYFTRSDDGREYFLADAGSKNGTFLNGERLAPREPVRVDDGASITFAEAQFRFSSATALYRILSRLSQAP